jgi:hypothetical protein
MFADGFTSSSALKMEATLIEAIRNLRNGIVVELYIFFNVNHVPRVRILSAQ